MCFFKINSEEFLFYFEEILQFTTENLMIILYKNVHLKMVGLNEPIFYLFLKTTLSLIFYGSFHLVRQFLLTAICSKICEIF